MNVKSFLEHYQIRENPFRAEEARQDEVFGRVESVCHHPDFEKICGSLDQPSTSIVFGEKGAGKTAIRLQIEQAVEEHNRGNANRRCFVVPYDDLNPVVDRFARHAGKSTPIKTLQQFALRDHMDAILAAAVPPIVDQILGSLRGQKPPLDLGADQDRQFRALDAVSKRDLMLLQICYDRPHAAPRRSQRLKRALRIRSENFLGLYKVGSGFLVLVTLAAIIASIISPPETNRLLYGTGLTFLILVTAALGLRFLWLWSRTNRLAMQLSRNLRVLDRSATSFRESLTVLGSREVIGASLPVDASEESRYAMMARLRNTLRTLGYQSLIILMDRVDEPSMVNGDVELMKALTWPLLNNKFLQQDGIGVKLLLPLELQFELHREGSDFYREARLDKQNLIERFSWSGATLYDLCAVRLNACRPGQEPMSLMEMFEPTVSQQDLVDALDQMQQPRDAFKFLYHLVQEHCSNIPEEEPKWQIARQTLDAVRKLEVDRLSQMLRGARPA